MMDLNLKNKVALVTGSTGGIGFSIADYLAKEGAVVYINGRSQKKVDEAIKKLKGDLRPAPYDLSNKEGCDSLIKALPTIDILVNNLGIYAVRPFEEITDAEWMEMFEVNVLSGIRLSRHYFPLMKQKNWGRIIFISSESGLNTPPEMIHYGMTKTAQIAVAKGLAELTKGSGVTVNSVLPGPTLSPGVEDYVKDVAAARKITKEEVERDFFKTVRPASLIQRFATADEVGACVAFVCSPVAAAINGTALRVDGGVIRAF